MFTPRSLRALLLVPALAGLAWLPLAAQAQTVVGSGNSVTETRNLPAFEAVKTVGSVDLEVRQGPQLSVQVQADDNLQELLETVVESSRDGPQLVVRWKRWQSLRPRSKTLVTVVMPTLNALSSDGSGDIRLEAFQTPRLRIALSGSGDVSFNGLATESLALSLAGSSDVVGSGKARAVKISIAGSGDVKLADLVADEVGISIAGSGDAHVHAEKTLDVSVAGSGDVRYRGNATVKSRVAGSGNIRKE